MMISFEPSSIVRRNSSLILGASIILAVIFIINAVISGYLLRRNTTDDRTDQLATLTLILAEHTSQIIFSANTVLNSIDDVVYAAKIEDEKSYRKFTSNKNQFELLEEKTKSNSILDVTTFVANDGKVLNFSRSYPAPEINLADRDYFVYLKNHNDLETFYSAPVQNKGNGKWVFYLARRVNGAHDEFLGIILVGVSVEVFSSLYERLGSNLGDGAAITLYRQDKTLLTRWPLVENLIGRVNTNNLIEQSLGAAADGNGVIFTSKTGFTRQNTSSVERMISYRKVTGYPFIVGAVVPETLYLANWYKNATGGLIATILSIIILFIGTYFLLRTYRRNAENQYRAHHDVLTRLPNRTLFSDRLSYSLANCKRNQAKLALLFIDLDNLKTINDVYGHLVGDAVLMQAAERIRACLRDTDTVARLGGDEFIVLLPGVGDEKNALMVAEKIRSSLMMSMTADGIAVSTSASIGVALYPDHGSNESDLMNNADMAMYEAKSSGRNTIQVFSEKVLKSVFKDIS
jgi:diguanylate cyclase (GGDEF)-like protein